MNLWQWEIPYKCGFNGKGTGITDHACLLLPLFRHSTQVSHSNKDLGHQAQAKCQHMQHQNHGQTANGCSPPHFLALTHLKKISPSVVSPGQGPGPFGKVSHFLTADLAILVVIQDAVSLPKEGLEAENPEEMGIWDRTPQTYPQDTGLGPALHLLQVPALCHQKGPWRWVGSAKGKRQLRLKTQGRNLHTLGFIHTLGEKEGRQERKRERERYRYIDIDRKKDR